MGKINENNYDSISSVIIQFDDNSFKTEEYQTLTDNIAKITAPAIKNKDFEGLDKAYTKECLPMAEELSTEAYKKTHMEVSLDNGEFDIKSVSKKKASEAEFAAEPKPESIEIEEVDDITNTMFGMEPISNKPKMENTEDIHSNTVVLPKIDSTYVSEEQEVEETPEVKEVKKEKKKILEFKRKEPKVSDEKGKAAYVDTVILCLIAQLSIFGFLIIVLLIIK